MNDENDTLLKLAREENGYKVIDISEEMDKYDLLSTLFHNKTIHVAKDSSISVSKNESKRYFGDNTVCYKCGDVGHTSRDCKLEVDRNCMYCDIFHKNKQCQYILCNACHNLGHMEKFCKEKRVTNILCKRCVNQRHYIKDCPRHWRKYKILNFNVKKGFIMSCPYCFSTTHFLDDCEMKDTKISIFTKHYKTMLKKSTQKE